MTRVALITGAARGIGLATAIEFVQHGREVWAVDRNVAPDLPDGVQFRKADLTDGNAVAALIDELRKERGQLDALVNNAAVMITKSILDTTETDWDLIQRTNVGAVFQACRAAFPLLEEAGGRSSTSARFTQ